VKLRAGQIVHKAIEEAIDNAVPYAVRRWFKYRDRCAGAELAESREFQEHVAEHVRGAAFEALNETIDFEDDAPQVRCAYRIEVYHGGGGWRWILRAEGCPVTASSAYHGTLPGAMTEAAKVAAATGLEVLVSTTPSVPEGSQP